MSRWLRRTPPFRSIVRGIPAVVFVGFAALLLLVHSSAYSQTAISSGGWQDAANWSGGTVPDTNADVVIPSGIAISLSDSTRPIRSLTIQGHLLLNQYRLIYTSSPSLALTVDGGVLDLGRGWTEGAGGITAAVRGGGEIRLVLDSLRSKAALPLFDLDSSSRFSYYGGGVQDISYLESRLLGGSYSNLRIDEATIGAVTFDDLRIRDTFEILETALLHPAEGPGAQKNLSIYLGKNFVNHNRGESGSSGAGRDGDGIDPDLTEWIITDSTYWQGPGEVYKLSIELGAVLRIRYTSFDRSDSILIAQSLADSGRVIGKLTTAPELLGATGASTDFHGLGLHVVSGDPPLGVTHVAVVSGIAPDGAFNGVTEGKPIDRYFRLYAENTNQANWSSLVRLDYRVEEAASTNIRSLRPWFSSNNGRTWGPSLLQDRITARGDYFLEWTTDHLAGNKTFWTLSDKEVDEPLPVLALSFSAIEEERGLTFRFVTASELGTQGFLIRDGTGEVASFRSEPKLRSKSVYGSSYELVLQASNRIFGENYQLYSVSDDGIESYLLSAPSSRSKRPWLSQSANVLIAHGDGELKILLYDITGAEAASGSGAIYLAGLAPGVYAARIFLNGTAMLNERILVQPH